MNGDVEVGWVICKADITRVYGGTEHIGRRDRVLRQVVYS
jgi:hypothetical protein